MTPLLARVYPNGSADVNQFQAAGGPGFVHPRADRRAAACTPTCATVADGRPRALRARAGRATAAASSGATLPAASGDDERRARARREPFSADGGLKLLHRQPRPRRDQGLGGAGRPPRRRGAGARVRHARRRCSPRSRPAQLERDFVAVVRFQGPRANGMPELHKLTPPLGGAAEARASRSRSSPTAA